MKLKTKLMMFTAAAALSANMAMAAVDPQALAQAYLAEGYSYVEVKVGPTQTKLEGVKGDRKVEVIYDNTSGTVIKQEFEDADDDYVGRTGIEIEDSRRDFVRDDDEGDDDEGDDDKNDDDEGNDRDDDESGSDDDEGNDRDDDESGSDDEGGRDDDNDRDDDTSGDDNDDDGEDGGED